MMAERSDTEARAVLESLCGPIPLRGVTDALAGAACEHCVMQKEGVRCTQCHAMFAVQSLAVTNFIRSLAEKGAGGQ